MKEQDSSGASKLNEEVKVGSKQSKKQRKKWTGRIGEGRKVRQV
jgi:hypothetical protein